MTNFYVANVFAEKLARLFLSDQIKIATENNCPCRGDAT